MTEGLSGRAARGLAADPNEPDPYKQTYQYDAFSNMTRRTSEMWNHEINPFVGNYVNDRNSGWVYDEAGNLKQDGMGRVTTWDVANRVSKWETVFDTITQKYDGDGRAVKRVETRSDPFFTSTKYYLRSSVMGGLVVAEINAGGKRELGYVYANGMEIGRYRKPSASQGFEVQWSHEEPMTGDRIEGGLSITTDPLGGLVPGSDPFVTPNVEYGDLLEGRESHTADSDPFSLGSGCSLDGVPIDCNVAISMTNNGAASIAPLKGVIAVIYQGQTALAFWQSYADGYEGFVPVTAVYTGGGGFRPAGPPKYSDLRVSKGGDTDFRALNRVGEDDPEALLARSVGFLSSGYQKSAIDSIDLKIEYEVPKDQKHELGSLRECGRFKIKVILSKVPGGYLNKINISRVEPWNYAAGGYRQIGESAIERKGDKITYTASLQVGNIIGSGGVGAVVARIFIPDPDYVPSSKPGEDPNAIKLGHEEKQKHYVVNGVRDDILQVRDTVRGVNEKDPFKDCPPAAK